MAHGQDMVFCASLIMKSLYCRMNDHLNKKKGRGGAKAAGSCPGGFGRVGLADMCVRVTEWVGGGSVDEAESVVERRSGASSHADVESQVRCSVGLCGVAVALDDDGQVLLEDRHESHDVDARLFEQRELRVETRARLPPTTVSIRVSFLNRISVVSSPIWTIESVLESHGPCASCELSLVLIRDRLSHSQNSTELHIDTVVGRCCGHDRRQRSASYLCDSFGLESVPTWRKNIARGSLTRGVTMATELVTTRRSLRLAARGGSIAASIPEQLTANLACAMKLRQQCAR